MVLETASLLTAAREQTGLTDLGDDSILEGLNILVDSLNTEAKLTEAGAQRWAASITATLANRMQVEDYLKSHPDLWQEDRQDGGRHPRRNWPSSTAKCLTKRLCMINGHAGSMPQGRYYSQAKIR